MPLFRAFRYSGCRYWGPSTVPSSAHQEGSNEAGKHVIAHGSVEFCEATPFDLLVDESEESLYEQRETDRNLRSA